MNTETVAVFRILDSTQKLVHPCVSFIIIIRVIPYPGNKDVVALRGSTEPFNTIISIGSNLDIRKCAF